MKTHNFFIQDVVLDKDTHKYIHKDGTEHISFSKMFELLSPKPDFKQIAYFWGKKNNMTTEEALEKWSKQTDEGTRLDVALKRASSGLPTLPEHQDLASLVEKISIKYKDYHSVYSDVVVFDVDNRTAGEIDRLCIKKTKTGLASNRFHISDFKRFEDGMSYEPKGQQWLNYPFSHYPNTKYTKITFQASYYAWHFEKLTGKKCERLFIDLTSLIYNEFGVPVDVKNTEVPVCYIKTDIELFLSFFKDKKSALLDKYASATSVKTDNNQETEILEF